MERKLREYFDAGVRQVWYVYPASREVRLYSHLQQYVTLTEQDTLQGQDVLPGFRVCVSVYGTNPRLGDHCGKGSGKIETVEEKAPGVDEDAQGGEGESRPGKRSERSPPVEP